jgi:hypothetical protein
MKKKKSGNRVSLYFDEWAFKGAMAIARFRTIGDVGRKIGISPTYMIQIAGGFIPPEEKRNKIAKALGVPVLALWKPVPVAAPAESAP